MVLPEQGQIKTMGYTTATFKSCGARTNKGVKNLYVELRDKSSIKMT